MGFSWQEYRSGFPFPPPGDFPDPWIEPGSPALVGRFFTTELLGSPLYADSVQLLSRVWPFATPWIAACQASLPITNSWSSDYIMWNVRLDELQVGIKIARRNSNNLKYADDITLMKESLSMRVKKESENTGLKLVIQRTKIVASDSITSWQIEEEKVETVTDLISLGSKITATGDCSHEIKRCFFLEGQL